MTQPSNSSEFYGTGSDGKPSDATDDGSDPYSPELAARPTLEEAQIGLYGIAEARRAVDFAKTPSTIDEFDRLVEDRVAMLDDQAEDMKPDVSRFESPDNGANFDPNMGRIGLKTRKGEIVSDIEVSHGNVDAIVAKLASAEPEKATPEYRRLAIEKGLMRTIIREVRRPSLGKQMLLEDERKSFIGEDIGQFRQSLEASVSRDWQNEFRKESRSSSKEIMGACQE